MKFGIILTCGASVRWLLSLALFLPAALGRTAGDPVFLPLVANLTRLASPGACGAAVSSITSGDPWSVIVGGDDDTTAPSSLCVARTFGRGRVVALGHTASCSATFSTTPRSTSTARDGSTTDGRAASLFLPVTANLSA